MNDDYMSEADNEVDGGYLADLEYAYQQKEIRRQEDKENKAKKEENRKQQLLRQNKCIENLKIKINKLKQQLAEKDKEIEKLKQQYTILENENGKLTTELIMDKYKKAQKEVSFGTQLAIQELEKVKEDCFNQKELVDFGNVACFMVDIADILEIINNQIKELTGEKDVED